MKTTYWAMLLMLLPSMAYTQTTEKENDFSMSTKSDPARSIVTVLWFPAMKGRSLRVSSTTVHASLWSTSVPTCRWKSLHSTSVYGDKTLRLTRTAVSMNEAWAKLNFGEGFFAQLGRQSLVYDDERILGGLDWNIAGRLPWCIETGVCQQK